MNKNTLFKLLPCVIMTLMSVSCKNEKEITLEQTAEKYLYATCEYNIEEACKYATPETALGLQEIGKTLVPMLTPDYIESNTPATIEIVDTKILSDTSATVIYHKTTPVSDYTDSIPLVYRQGEWLVKLSIVIPPYLKENEKTTRNTDGSITTTFKYDSVGTLTIKKEKKQ